MSQKRYKDAFDALQPSPALRQETLELMKEVQSHRMTEEPPKKTRKLAYTLSLASTAAAVALCLVLAPFLAKKGELFEESEGQWDTLDQDNSSFFEDQFSSLEDADGLKGKEPTASAPNADADLKSDDEAEENKSENNTGSNAPVIIDTPETTTYLSLGEFVGAIEKMETAGFGTHYISSKELTLLPASLPQGTRFRCLYLDTQSGSYTYSFLLEKGYYLEVKVTPSLPKTADELAALQENLPADYTLKKSENQRSYLFGEFAEMTVSLLPIGSAPLPDEAAADEILNAFEPTFYTENNPYLDLTY